MWRHQIQSDDPVLRDQEWSQSALRSPLPVDPRKKNNNNNNGKEIQEISQRVCNSRGQSGKLNSDNSNVSANPNKAPLPLDLTPSFSYFYSVNSNSNNSNLELYLRQQFDYLFMEGHLATYHRCHPIRSSCRVIGKNTKTLQQFDLTKSIEQCS